MALASVEVPTRRHAAVRSGLRRPDPSDVPHPLRTWLGPVHEPDRRHLIVYSPKHGRERSIFDTSPYVLLPGATTPDAWDCKGFLVPTDRTLQRWRKRRRGPLAVKFWNFRRFWVKRVDTDTYRCPWDNGIFEPSQINWAIPNFSYQDIVGRLRVSGEGYTPSG
jgi:hypothetical protein